MTVERSTEKKPSIEGIVLGWWSSLQPDPDKAKKDRHRGERAQLRRCANAAEVALVPAFHVLLAKVRDAGLEASFETGWSEGRISIDDLAVLAQVAIHVKENRPDLSCFGRAMAEGGPEHSVVSEFRFRRLLRIEDRQELGTALVRVLKMLEGVAPLVPLLAGIHYWGDKTKKQWARDYFAKALSIEGEERN